MNLAVFPLLLPMMELKNGNGFPEAMLFILKAIQMIVSGLLRLKLQIKCEPFSKLTYFSYFVFGFDSIA